VKDECLHTEILDQDTDFVAVKDIYKTCGCSKDFVHGLAIAREPVTGVEDPRTATNPRLAGAWAFAWKVALKRIGDGDAVLLLSNPFSHRSQDQLHVHFLRPAPGFRDKLLSLVAGSSDPKELATNVRAVADRVADLGDIWRVAKKVAGRVGFKEYGVAVLRDGEKFLVAAVDGSRREDLSPEKGLGLYQCPERRAIRE
jgi:CDP-diacylglycerol pyrophosphatase